jgi:hypothetical protein
MVTRIDRRRLSGTGVAEPHAQALLDKLDDVVDAVNNVAAGMLPNGSVSTAELADGAVTEGKLATGAVTADKLGAGSIGDAKVAAAAAIAGSKVACAEARPLDTFYGEAKALVNELRALVGASLPAAAVTIEHAADPGLIAARVVPLGLARLASFGADGGGGGGFGLVDDGFPMEDDATAPPLYHKGGALVADLTSVWGGSSVLIVSGAGRFLSVAHDPDPATGGVAVQYAAGALKATFADETNKTVALEPGAELLSRTRTVAAPAVA